MGGPAVAVWDDTRRERWVVCATAVLLVLLRSVVPTLYEGFYFDSDQAIVGLMAKHLSTFQRFPLFYYGLNYILGVEAWIIAPFFWLARPSVAIMRLPLIALNALVAVWLIAALGRQLGLRPFIAFVAALPFIIPTPVIASQLLETAGASVEPFVYILLLWRLRHRPLAFGALQAIAYLHREFTIFAVPALMIVEAAGKLSWFRENARHIAWMGAGFGIVWLVVDGLKRYLSGASLTLQAVSLSGQVCVDLQTLPGRAVSLLTEALPTLFGGAPTMLQDFRMDTAIAAGYSAVGWILAAAFVVMVLRLTRSRFRPSNMAHGEGFGAYLSCVGVFTACAYPLSCNIIRGGAPLLRYLLLGLLVPVGCCATFMRQETVRALRVTVASVFVVCGAVNLVDNVRLIRATAVNPPLNERRGLADYLVSHHVRYARAIYWDAYVVDFLSRERVIVASSDIIRIPEYQQQVEAHSAGAVDLTRMPCAGGERVASWCVQKP